MPGSILPFQLAPASTNLSVALPVVRQSAARITARRRTEILGKNKLTAGRRMSSSSRQMPLQTNSLAALQAVAAEPPSLAR